MKSWPKSKYNLPSSSATKTNVGIFIEINIFSSGNLCSAPRVQKWCGPCHCHEVHIQRKKAKLFLIKDHLEMDWLSSFSLLLVLSRVGKSILSVFVRSTETGSEKIQIQGCWMRDWGRFSWRSLLDSSGLSCLDSSVDID